MGEFCKFLLLSFVILNFVGCDNGMSELRSLEKGFPELVENGLTENNLKDGSILFTLYKLHSKAHVNKKSENVAKEKMKKMHVEAVKLKEKFKGQLDMGSQKIVGPLTEYMKAATDLIQNHESKKKSAKHSRTDHQKVGYCYISLKGSEFDSIEQKVTNYNVKKIVKLGEEEVLVKSVIEVGKGDLISPSTVLAKIEAGTSESESKYSFYSKDLVKCEEALKVASLYKKVVELATKEIEPVSERIKSVSVILNGGAL